MNHDHYPDSWIRETLGLVHSVAVVGASSRATRPSYFVMKYLQSKGFRLYPVNPAAAGETILGQICIAQLQDLPEPVDMVDIFRGREAVPGIIDEILQLPVLPKVVWMQFTIRDDEAAAKAERAGMRVVMDRCPKVEYARLHGEIGWQGLNSNIITSKRRKPRV